MIKIDNPIQGGGVTASLLLTSDGTHPSIFCLVEDVRKQVNGAWIDDPTSKRQVVRCFVGGEAVELQGKVMDGEAVQAGQVWGVKADVSLVAQLTAARNVGDRSQEIARISLVRVVQVLGAPGKVLWPTNGEASKVRGFDPVAGKVTA